MSTTIEFDLPFGYEADDGTIHRTVTMRRVRNEDLIAVSRDTRVQALAKQNLKIDLALLQSDGRAGELRPVDTQLIQATMLEMNAILYSRVVLSIGTIDKIDARVFGRLTPADMECIQKHYEEFNAPPRRQDEDSTGDAHPFRPSET